MKPKADPLSSYDSSFLSYLRGLSIFVIVFGHVGGFWFFRPYSEFLHVFVPIFFFLSGAVSFFSYSRSPDLKTFYFKRIISLFIPFYLLGFLSWIVWVVVNQQIPSFNFSTLVQWIQIRPFNDNLIFPVGHVWFLHTLLIITLISPLYFSLQKNNETLLFILMAAIILFSGIQLFFDIDNFFSFSGHNFYKPIVHSGFYIFGILYFNSARIRNLKSLIFFLIFFLALCISTCILLRLNIDFGVHTYAPDLYYVSGSFFFIIVVLILQKQIVAAIENFSLLKTFLSFFYKHTFSIYLIHKFSIYLAEQISIFNNPPEKTITYGITKLFVVLLITGILSIPYSYASSKIIDMLNKKIIRPKY